MELMIFGKKCKIRMMGSKRGRDVKKCVKWEKRLASTDILLMSISGDIQLQSFNSIKFYTIRVFPVKSKLEDLFFEIFLKINYQFYFLAEYR